MLKNSKKPLRTKALVLRRTNYGETDRILNLLTPEGQISARARGVRKEKSRLAGGVEMFCLSDVVLHVGKSDLAVLTSAKMLDFYKNLLTDLPRLELAADFLKRVARASASVDSPEFFEITNQSLRALDRGFPAELVEAWFLLNLARVSGDEPNFRVDTSGENLRPDAAYRWDSFAAAFSPDAAGPLNSDHIKLLRLILVAPLDTVASVKQLDSLLPELYGIIRTWQT